MKMIKTTILSLALVFAATAATAQKTTGVTRKATPTSIAPTTTSVEEVKVDQEYAIKTDKLTKSFISGKIPADFPKYDQAISFDDNKKIGIGYLANHKKLLTQEALDKLASMGL